MIGAQRYPGAAALLQTDLRTPDVSIDISDDLIDGVLTRLLTVRRGPAVVRLDVVPGHAFGPPRRVERWSGGIAFGSMIVRGLPEGNDVLLTEGERVVVTIEPRDDRGVVHRNERYATLDPNLVLRHRGDREKAASRVLGTVAYDGRYNVEVRGAVRMLRLLTDRSTGALVSSPCASLPVRTGNERNVDHRYAYLRDNARSVRLWERLERFDWADATRSFLAGVAADELPLAPCYRAEGERPPGERESDLRGWRGHTPVRIGSRAAEGLDLAGMAEVALALDPRTQQPLIERICDWLAEHPLQADHGRWDERTRPKLLTSSQLAVRAALDDRARFRPPLDASGAQWTDEVETIGQWVVAEALGGRRPSSVVARSASDPTVDAAVLRWLPFTALPGDDATAVDGGEQRGRTRATVDAVIAQLGEGPYCHRHAGHVDDGFPPGTSPDVAASFELVRALSMLGRWDEAHDRMEALCSFVGPLGLPPAHADRPTGDHRGNLCSAPAAIALVEAALALAAGPR